MMMIVIMMRIALYTKNNTPNEISSGFNTVDMFSMYV